MENTHIHAGKISKIILLINITIALVYFSWWFFIGKAANVYLYNLLVFGEAYHVLMAILFWLTIWPKEKKPLLYAIDHLYTPPVDIFVTVAGEPVDVVSHTIMALKQLSYKNKRIYILNDGYVAKKDNWEQIEQLAKELSVVCITRKKPGGAKAGNINHALRLTDGELIAVFDADMQAHPDFLDKTVPFFQNARVGFVQSPQYYKNHDTNEITRGAWEQQEFFFGPIMQGKDNVNSAFICGTNFVIRRTALESVGGMCEDNIAEDFLTSQKIHQKKWLSHYIPEVLAEGLAPEDLLSYYKQQLRWCRGSIEVLFSKNPLLKWHLTLSQKLQYLSSALYYFNGLVVLIDICMPLIFLYTGIVPVASTTTSFALFFIPFMYINLYTLFVVSQGSMTFRAISFSQSSFVLQIQALLSLLVGQKMEFAVTSKKAIEGNFLSLAYPHIGYVLLTILGMFFATYREGMNPSVVTNIAWAAFNIILFIPYIQASYRWKAVDMPSYEKAI